MEPTLEVLRTLARQAGVEPSDADLETVLAFLQVLLPALGELEKSLTPASTP